MTPIKGISALAVTTAILLWISSLLATSTPISVTMIVGAGVQSTAAFWALLWALSKSDRVFFSVFVGDALLRLVVLGFAVCWVYWKHVDYTAPLLAFGFSTLILSFVQIPFFYRARAWIS